MRRGGVREPPRQRLRSVGEGDSSSSEYEFVLGEHDDNTTPFEDVNVGDKVEVYWHGERKWFAGVVTGCDGGLVEVYYNLDKHKLWHSEDDYKIRRL